MRYSKIATSTATIAAIISIYLTATGTASAGIFDDPKNLEVLPEYISAEDLRQTMRGFVHGTGSRCSGCHVGKVEADLNTYDFSLDDKEKKLTARKMIQLVRDINENISDLFPDSDEPLVTVTCATCHRGQAKPEMIEDVVLNTLHDEGLDESIAKYLELREQFYGSYTFDFRERVLARIAEILGAEENFTAALSFVNLNLEYFPESSRTYILRAQVLTELGDIDAARSDYETALEMLPDSGWIREQLDNLNQ